MASTEFRSSCGSASPTDDALTAQIEHLKSELMTNSLVHELTNVMHSCTDLDEIIKTVMLGIQEILFFDRVILFD